MNGVHSELPCRTQILPERIPVPRVYRFAIRLWNLHDCGPQRILSRNHGSAGRKKAAPRVYDGRDMGLKKRQHGPEIGENDIGSAGEPRTVGKRLEKPTVFTRT